MDDMERWDERWRDACNLLATTEARTEALVDLGREYPELRQRLVRAGDMLARAEAGLATERARADMYMKDCGAAERNEDTVREKLRELTAGLNKETALHQATLNSLLACERARDTLAQERDAARQRVAALEAEDADLNTLARRCMMAEAEVVRLQAAHAAAEAQVACRNELRAQAQQLRARVEELEAALRDIRDTSCTNRCPAGEPCGCCEYDQAVATHALVPDGGKGEVRGG